MTTNGHPRGQAVVEFALAASAFLLVFFAIVSFGEANYFYNRIAEAARIGARYAIANTKKPSSDCAQGVGTSTVCLPPIVTYIGNKSGLDTTKLTTTITFGGTSTDTTYTDCSTNPTVGCWVNVRITYPYDIAVLNRFGSLVASSSQMTITSQY